MRLFLAVEFERSLLDALETAIAPLRAEAPELAWVPPDKRHLTVKFLGDVADDAAARVVEFMDAVARRHRPFDLAVGGIGAFPNFRRARVVWVGVEHEARLELLHHDIEEAGADNGFEIEGRPFRPHLTLARVKAPLPDERARRLARESRKVGFSATSVVSQVTLFESTLTPRGSRYRHVHVAPLGGR